MVKKNGTLFWAHLVATLAQDVEGVSRVHIAIIDITERKKAEAKRDMQLLFSNALNKIAQVIISQDIPEELMERSNRIIGETLQLDRALIYDVSFEKNHITGLCEWLKQEHPDIVPTKAVYPLELFLSSFSEIRRTQKYLESHSDAVNEHFIKDGAGELLHGQMKIKSLIWYPFAFDDHGYYVFTLNQILCPRQWTEGDLTFLDSAAKQISLALMKIKLLKEKEADAESLRVSEDKHRLITQMQQGVAVYEIILDKAGKPVDCRFLEVNNSFERLTGLKRENIIGKTVLEILPDTESDQIAKYGQVAKTGEPIQYENYEKELGKYFEVVAYSPQHQQVATIISDITERRQAEEALRCNQAMLARTENIAQIGSWEWDVAKDTVTWSDELFRLFQRNPADGTPSFAEHPKLYHPEDMQRLGEVVEEAVNNGTPYEIELRAIRTDGAGRVCLARGHVEMSTGSRATHLFGSLQDITERKLAEDKIKNLLTEKEIILKEVHHRIKNNMGTINGLLSLQAGTLQDPQAIAALEDAGNRVQSMIVLYDKLYQSSNYQEMSIGNYIPTLVDEILANFPNAKSVKVEKNIGDFILDAKRLQLLGIIVNELLTNIMKYAFAGREAGIITVSAVLKDNKVTVIIGDNGNGMPETVDFETSSGFGLLLVRGLTQQLGGTIRIERGHGTRIVLEFGKKTS